MRNLFFSILAVVLTCVQGSAENNSVDDITELKAEITRLQAEIEMWQGVVEMTIEENTVLKQKSAGPTEMDEGTNYLIQSAQERAREAEKKLLGLELEVDRLRKLREDYLDAIAEKTKLERKLNDLLLEVDRLTAKRMEFEAFYQVSIQQNDELLSKISELRKELLEIPRLNRELNEARELLSKVNKLPDDGEVKDRKIALLTNENISLKKQLGQARKDLVELKLAKQNQAEIAEQGPRLTSELLEKTFNSLTRDERMSVQAVLRARGFYKSSIDGIWGKGTNAALIKFAESVEMMNASPLKVMNATVAGMNIYYSDESRGGRAPSGNSYRGNSSGLVALVNNPSASASQAKSICRGEAANAASAYSRSLPPTNFDADCDTWGSNNISCTGSFSRGGGFWGGAADALQEANVRNRTYRSCLARYGWAEK